MNIDAIPAELRERPQWVTWRLVDRDPKPTKVPYRADGNGRASSTDPNTWASFDEALAGRQAQGADGIGYVFSPDDPYAGVDLDAELPEIERDLIMYALDSYAEASVSGNGVHVIVKASLNGHGRNRKGPFEVYDRDRYFVVTGDHVDGTPYTIERRQEELDQVIAEYLPETEPARVPSTAPRPVELDDRELLDRASAAKNGRDFDALYAGSWEGRYPSQSEADLALCSALAFWTGNDPDRIDRLFRSSGLYRDKWERPDYREGTIQNAFVARPYKPPRSRLGVSESPESPSKFGGAVGGAGGRGLGDSALKESPSPRQLPPREDREGEGDSEAESPSGSGRPFSMPIRTFVELERPHREPLLADDDGRAVVGRHSLILLGALGGHGKTTFFVDLALHLAAGVDYPPLTVPRAASVLMIENEGPEELFAEKLKARLAAFPHELKGRLDVCTFDWGGFSLADADARAQLAREIAANEYDLVFGDPLDSLGIEGVGSPEDTRKFLALMKETGLNKTVAWWLNTHPRKEETKEALNEISGAWGGKPDTVFLLRMLEGDRTRIRQPKLRWARRGKGPTLLYAFDPDTEAFTFIGEESDEQRDYVGEIKAFLADDKWLTVKEIAKPKKDGGLGVNSDTVKQVLEEHPDVFEMRTGDAARELGRKSEAKLWGLKASADEDGDNITWAEYEDASLELQHRTGAQIHPMKDVIAEMHKAREERDGS